MNDVKHIGRRLGTIFGLGLVVYGVMFRVAGLSFDSPLAVVFYAVLPAAAWLAAREVRQLAGDHGFKAQLAAGSYATLLAAAIYVVSVYLYNVLIDDSLLTAVNEYVRQTAIEAGKTGAELDAAVRKAAFLSRPLPFTIVVFFQLATAGLASALTIAGWNRWMARRREC